MTVKLIVPIIAAGILLGACRQGPQEPLVTRASCDQEQYQNVIGRNIGEVGFAVTVNERVLTEGFPVSISRDPQRLNVVVDEKGWIKKIYCG